MHRAVDLTPPAPAALRRDVLASVIVFLVALPLCLGIAKACGMPPAAGLITGIIGGLIVGCLSGSPLQVSGPAAGLIVLVAKIVQEHGPVGLGVVVTIAGVIQIVAGVLKLGQWFRAVAPAVIQGMLAGIGVLIFASQFHIMIDDVKGKDGIDDLLKIPASIYKVFNPGDANHHYAAWVGLTTLGVLLVWKLAPKKVQIIPGALLAVVAGSALAAGLRLPIQFVQLPDNLLDAVRLPTAETARLFLDHDMWTAGLTIALVASAETLLCAAAVDGMHQGPRTQYDKELWAQGVGNTLCGLVGALPMTGVIVRSATNVQAGAKTRLSAILHGLWLLLLVVLLPGLLKLIPTAALAAILVYTGVKLMNVHEARKLFRQSRGEFAIYAITLITIVATDLLVGVVTGIVLSSLKLLFTFSHLEVRVDEEDGRTILHLEGAATFLRLPRLAEVLEKVRPNTELHVQFDHLAYIDHACLELLVNWEKQHAATGGALVIDWESLRAKFRSPRRPAELVRS